MAALWAWETFGGLGARTRRGFGALACCSIKEDGNPKHVPLPTSANVPDVSAWLKEQLAAHVVAETLISDVPHLSPSVSSTICRIPARFFLNNKPIADVFRELLRAGGVKQPADRMINALVAWYYPIEQMKNFRQRRRRSEANGSRFGRSYWPEPDEIRARTKGFNGRHARRLTTAPKFPRAVFGLPIVFRFKDTDIDPPDTTLQGAQHARLASRLILRPLACADERFASVATLLDRPALPPGGLKLDGGPSGRPISIATLSPTEAAFVPLDGNPDVLQAFLATL
jgi:CRISPR-associated protein Cmr1